MNTAKTPPLLPRRQQHANQGDPWRHARCGGNRWSGDQRGSGRFGERRPIHLRARRAIRFRNDRAGCARSAGERASRKRPRPRRPEIPYRDGVRRRKPRQGEDRERAALRVGARNSGTLPRRDQGGGARPPARSARGHDPLQHGEHHWAAVGRRRRQQMAAALRRGGRRPGARATLRGTCATSAGYVRPLLLGPFQRKRLRFSGRCQGAQRRVLGAARFRPRLTGYDTKPRGELSPRPSRRRCIRNTRWPDTCYP